MSKKSKNVENVENEEELKQTAEAEAAQAEAEAAEEAAEDPKDKEIATLKDQLLRNMAEYDNYRKRTSKERLDLVPEITAKTVTEFLPVIDNLERALDNQCSDENYKKGVEMIYQGLMDTLEKLGVEVVPIEGQFDPGVHQAVQQVPSDELESGMIANTFQKGYKLGDKILRFAMVAVVS